MGNPNDDARRIYSRAESRVASRRRAQVNPEDRILNINQGDFESRLMQLSQQGLDSGYLLAGTGDNMFLVAGSPEELNEVVGYWVSPNYYGSVPPDPYYRSRDENIPDEPDDTWLDALQDDIMRDASSSGLITFDQVLARSNAPFG